MKWIKAISFSCIIIVLTAIIWAFFVELFIFDKEIARILGLLVGGMAGAVSSIYGLNRWLFN